jgi:hypothetical protein
MPIIVSKRSAVISYAAGIAAIAGLMAVVAFGASVTPAKRSVFETLPQVATAKSE